MTAVVSLLLVVEDHPVRGEVEASSLVPAEHGAGLAREAHCHVVAEQEDAKGEGKRKRVNVGLKMAEMGFLNSLPRGGGPRCWRGRC